MTKTKAMALVCALILLAGTAFAQIDTEFIISNAAVVNDAGTDYLQWDVSLNFLGASWALPGGFDEVVKNIQFYITIDPTKFANPEFVIHHISQLDGGLYPQNCSISVAQNQVCFNYMGQNSSMMD
ncbi:MAG: hypothetical protein K8S56_01370, partial [Candidatus Cloacimonetes bacterium]|nr:hypothetical protein [Candidatus Cloacimonadota bacterium]